jgi:hypothetical protein
MQNYVNGLKGKSDKNNLTLRNGKIKNCKPIILINYSKFLIMKRSVLFLAAIVTFIAASFAFISADEPRYKNLKVLSKNITKKELDSVMHFFSVSMGEKCNFCHVWNNDTKKMDFASDANPNKNVARSMMRMAKKINKKYFKNREDPSVQAVTCYTCHHGSGFPLIKPAPVRKDSTGSQPHQ